MGSLRLGELTTTRLDRFVQAVLADRGYATAKLTRSVLSGICGWLVRQGAIASNPVRDLAPLEQNRDRTARALSAVEVVTWLALLDADDFARRLDLPELARFMLATGLRLGEALGITWADLDLVAGSVTVQRTIIRVQGQGLVAKRVKSRASERRLLLPTWCVDILKARRVRLGAFDGPVFADSKGDWRARSNVGKAFRQVRDGSHFEWVKFPHLPQDRGDPARRKWCQRPHDRRPAGPLRGLDDAGGLPRAPGRERPQPRCARVLWTLCVRRGEGGDVKHSSPHSSPVTAFGSRLPVLNRSD
ncbi:MAG TPA: hypothetical protein VEQ66_15665 [Propionibacteriaceae bacterium]|nr:hypothetical protein [Propionibacteriaceae bacterium]